MYVVKSKLYKTEKGHYYYDNESDFNADVEEFGEVQIRGRFETEEEAVDLCTKIFGESYNPFCPINEHVWYEEEI